MRRLPHSPRGKAFAGGLSIPTPFGTIVTPNITPDRATGIGAWTDQQFYHALHDGIGAHGENLYPAFPYPWFTRVTRPDVMAIKAYLFSLPPVHAPKQPNDLIFPFNLRIGLAAWNWRYFHPGTFKPDPNVSAQINRGAYLVEGLGHCGACHTPKNIAQAPKAGQSFGGGEIQGWYAPNISADVREGVGGWTDAQLVTLLKTGAVPGKGIVRGPMLQTVHDSLSQLTDSDLEAMAAYLKSTPSRVEYPPTELSVLQSRARRSI